MTLKPPRTAALRRLRAPDGRCFTGIVRGRSWHRRQLCQQHLHGQHPSDCGWAPIPSRDSGPSGGLILSMRRVAARFGAWALGLEGAAAGCCCVCCQMCGVRFEAGCWPQVLLLVAVCSLGSGYVYIILSLWMWCGLGLLERCDVVFECIRAMTQGFLCF